MAKGATEQLVDRQKWLDGVADIVQPAVKSIYQGGGGAGKVAKDFMNGVWLGHPLHPVITDVPVGAWTLTQLFDIMSIASGDDERIDAASDVALGAGIVAAVAAAATGITDWSDSSGSLRRMGLAHGLVNSVGLVLNVASLFLRMGGKKNRGLARSLSATGYLFNGLAAYIGGELVYSLGQGVDRQAWVAGPSKFTDAAPLEDLQPDKMVKVDVDGSPVVLLQHDDGIHAFGGACTHLGCPLWEGELDGHVLTCQCHGSQFDVTDGHLIHGPATAPVASYEVRQRSGKVQVRLKNR